MELTSDPDQLAVQLDPGLPSTLPVGDGSCLFVSGSCFHPDLDLKRLSLLIGDRPQPVIAHGMPRVDRLRELDAAGGAEAPSRRWASKGSAVRRRAYRSGFWALIPLERVERSQRLGIHLHATLDGGRVVEQRLGDLDLVARPAAPVAEFKAARVRDPRVAICMATHDPPPDLLERQLRSLRDQTHDSWVCLISDDCSSRERFERLRSLVGDDSRFAISRSPERVGFYRNFERALRMVPEGVDLVAMCDQDDDWYPQKLRELVAGMGSASLVYSDARIVDESGQVLSHTYWRGRRNNHTNLASLLIANTVTGAACMFPRRLLDLALPFPPVQGRALHDHWLACIALATGHIAYIDRPLYDYVQHGSAAVGHPAAGTAIVRTASGGVRGRIRDLLWRGRRSYFWNVCRVALMAEVLEVRCQGGSDPAKRRAVRRLRRLGRPPEPVVWLALRSLRRLAGLNETQHYEWSLVAGVAWRRVTAMAVRLSRRPGHLANRSDPFLREGSSIPSDL